MGKTVGWMGKWKGVGEGKGGSLGGWESGRGEVREGRMFKRR